MLADNEGSKSNVNQVPFDNVLRLFCQKEGMAIQLGLSIVTPYRYTSHKTTFLLFN